MGRPGFNQCHWFDFSLEEGVVFTWLGKQSATILAVDNLWHYVDEYGPKVAPFHSLSPSEAQARLQRLRDLDVLGSVLTSMNAKAGILQNISWHSGHTNAALQVTLNSQRVHYELALLQRHNVSVVISLLEQPLDHALLMQHFEVHHLPVEDVTPPSYEQVYAFTRILRTALAAGKTVVTHCLAGVGRTTTMFLAAYLVQGYRWHELQTWIQVRNPHFQFKGRQVAFLQELAQDIMAERVPLLRDTPGARLCLLR
jgi:protein-tyrosine phosphatase